MTPLLAWLREHVHPVGRALNAEQLVEQVSGRPLSSAPFLSYLDDKLDKLSALGRPSRPRVMGLVVWVQVRTQASATCFRVKMPSASSVKDE